MVQNLVQQAGKQRLLQRHLVVSRKFTLDRLRSKACMLVLLKCRVFM